MDTTQSYDKTAAALLALKTTIIDEFQIKAREKICSAKDESSQVIIDHLPDVLEEIALSLRNRQKHIEQAIKPAVSLARSHGVQRATETNYSLNDLLKEYALLREIIFDNLYSIHQVDEKSSKQIHFFLDESLTLSILEFIDFQEQKMKGLMDNLEVEKKVRERFVISLTHDLRTPLASARVSSELILRKVHDQEAVIKHASRIANNLQRVDDMIQDMLDVAIIQGGKMPSLDYEESDVCQIINEVLDDLSSIHGARFTFNGPKELKGHFSSKGIRRVIENLCINAVKYGAPAEPISLELKENEETITISVHNEGNPIPEEEQMSLFDQFHRLKRDREGNKKGWGIGLTLVKGIVEAHHGEIKIKSDKDSGTIFQITIPKKRIIQ